jgi:hypothetical protein
VRYGGLFDLCSLNTSHQHEKVLARLAVIHRERLMAR